MSAAGTVEVAETPGRVRQRVRAGRARLRLGRPQPVVEVAAAALLLATFWVLTRSVLRWVPGEGQVESFINWLGVAVAGVLVLALVRRSPDVEPAGVFGQRVTARWLLVAVLALPPLYMVIKAVFNVALGRFVGPVGTMNDIPANSPPGDVALSWVEATVLAPIYEEILFRGALIAVVAHYSRRTWPVLVLPALAWGLAHGGSAGSYNLAQCVGITAVGIVMGWIALRTRSLLPGIIAHSIGNTIATDDTPGTNRISGILLLLLATGWIVVAVIWWVRVLRESPVTPTTTTEDESR